jgi:hypothetical protein
LLTALSGPLIFLNLYYVHSYYLIASFPAIIAIMAIGMVWVIRAIRAKPWQQTAVGAVVVGSLALSLISSPLGFTDVENYRHSPAPAGAPIDIRENTEPGSLIVIVGCDWDPTGLYYAGREGLMIRGLPLGETWSAADIRDYDYLYNCVPGSDTTPYLPAGYEAQATDTSGLYTIVRQ